MNENPSFSVLWIFPVNLRDHCLWNTADIVRQNVTVNMTVDVQLTFMMAVDDNECMNDEQMFPEQNVDINQMCDRSVSLRTRNVIVFESDYFFIL